MTTRLKNKLAMHHDQVREAYRNGATLRQIGEVHGVSPGTVRNVLVDLGESLRSRGRRKKIDMHDPRILNISGTPEVEPVVETIEPETTEDIELETTEDIETETVDESVLNPTYAFESGYEGGNF